MDKADILIVEDEQITMLDIRDMIENLGYSVPAVADSSDEALEALEEHPIDLVLMDIRLNGGMSGIEVAEVVNERFEIPVIYLTAHSDEKTIERSKPTRPAGFLVKPITEADLRSAIEMALSNASKRAESDSKSR